MKARVTFVAKENVWPRGASAWQHAEWLARGSEVEAVEWGNMPGWAAANPGEFWRAATWYQEGVTTRYREFVAVLPQRLGPTQCVALVRAFVVAELGDRHAYHWMIHRPRAGQRQPHAHIMFSDRLVDGIRRDPKEYFMKYRPRSPEKGGCRRGYGSKVGIWFALHGAEQQWKALVQEHLRLADHTGARPVPQEAHRAPRWLGWYGLMVGCAAVWVEGLPLLILAVALYAVCQSVGGRHGS